MYYNSWPVSVPTSPVLAGGIGYVVGSFAGERLARTMGVTGQDFWTCSLIGGAFGAIGSCITCHVDDLLF